MELLWLTLQFVLSRKVCPHWDSLYCNCASERRRDLAQKINAYLHAKTPESTIDAFTRIGWFRSSEPTRLTLVKNSAKK